MALMSSRRDTLTLKAHAPPSVGGLLTAEPNFARDFPDGPGREDQPPEIRKPRDLLRGVTLFSTLALGAWLLSGPLATPDAASRPRRLRRVMAFHAAAWGVLGVLSAVLRALGP